MIAFEKLVNKNSLVNVTHRFNLLNFLVLNHNYDSL